MHHLASEEASLGRHQIDGVSQGQATLSAYALQMDGPIVRNASIAPAVNDAWRVIYVVETEDKVVSVLAIRQRPPYQYEDLGDLTRHRRR